ncbi:MAG: type III pantothenate kinase [Propionivibrio sp.]
MNIAIDAGNSRIKWGIHDGRSWVNQGSVPTEDAAALAGIVSHWPADARVVACSVAGTTVESIIEKVVGERGLRLSWARSEAFAHGVRNGYEQPERLGADRWAALIGARSKVRGACLVVCAGTATTVDWLDAAGNFRGGLILPGVNLMLAALARNTAQLPHADGEYRAEPRNTMDAIVSGCLNAQAGAIERMFARVSAEERAECLMTGGAAYRILPCLGIPCRVEGTLVLDGLLRYASGL